MGQTVNLLSFDFGGSNPSLPTTLFRVSIAGIAQLIEHQPSKLRVAGLSPVSRSTSRNGAVVARRAHNPKVVGSSPASATHQKA